MRLRRLLLLPALALPIAGALAVAHFALPMVQDGGKNSTANIAALPKDSPRKLPETVEEARRMAVARLMHLQRLTQEQWNAERKTVLYKNPPADLNAAIARTQIRVSDLNGMTQQQWAKERERIVREEQKRLAKK